MKNVHDFRSKEAGLNAEFIRFKQINVNNLNNVIREARRNFWK